MHLSWVSTLSHIIVCIALSLPTSPQLLPSSSHKSVSKFNQTEAPLQTWPPTPWIRHIGSLSMIFNKYGRSAPAALEYDIITSIQSIYERVMHGRLIGRYMHWLHEGIVAFYIVYDGEVVMLREEIALILVEVQILYLNHIYGPREILSADVKHEGLGRMIATFQVRFIAADGRADAITAPPSGIPPSQLERRSQMGES